MRGAFFLQRRLSIRNERRRWNQSLICCDIGGDVESCADGRPQMVLGGRVDGRVDAMADF